MRVLRLLRPKSIALAYVDPPFTLPTPAGSGSGGSLVRYAAFLAPRLRLAHQALAENGALHVHLDVRTVHVVKVLLDRIFGEVNFVGEIVWAFPNGARVVDRWTPSHQTILIYAKRRAAYRFDYPSASREVESVGGLRAAPDVWLIPALEEPGYSRAKPVEILRRIVAASSDAGDTVLDFFSGSGTTGVAAGDLGRRFILVDSDPDAFRVMLQRCRPFGYVAVGPSVEVHSAASLIARPTQAQST